MVNSLFRRKSLTKILSDSDASGDIHAHELRRVLSVRDLTFFGIAAIIGAGSFSSMGTACASGGPGVIFLFILCGIACGFTAMCYAEFASRIPVAGSAYTYAYASFGELMAWVIGWALLMEYSIGNIYVAFAWSDYFTNLLHSLHIYIPGWLSTNYKAVHDAVIKNENQELISIWNTAPKIGTLRIIVDLPALLINVLITWLVYVGVKESRNISNLMVIIKLVAIVLVILVGITYINTDNWLPLNEVGMRSFMPNGFSGVMAGVSAVFFAYIGFDAVSTMAEESKNPQRDLPKGMIYSLIICTIVYIILSLVLTGMVDYKLLNVGDPLAEVFQQNNVGWMKNIISVIAVVAMTSVMLVFQLGQPRIWMSMSRDGLLPAQFQRIHPKHKTPSFSTIVTGIVVGLPIIFTDERFVLDFTSIGTLFAFVLVCGGVLLIPRREKQEGKFHLPYINGRLIYPLIITGLIAIIAITSNRYFPELLNGDFSDHSHASNAGDYLLGTPVLKISTIIFWLVCIVLSVFAFMRKLSLIPLMGLTTCLYLLTGMSASNWKWFFIWFAIGLVLYFSYGYRKSKLAAEKSLSVV
ncbi:amino acid permease [Chitinophagaceae bacterium LB-8]|uniref:Amino acid permease n=1 Tax=Paraflavisolibacter caeni TaxID=2982496 RepID=A0A9X2XYC3_9BACT|nr:amino acid permease [Paraflavisolibacter caeni]MCU7551475.1 amino acid permease [Paraflavisolibacter caeni]